ncbi:sensor histidine kinase [Microvirga antarctica]|uniref:sensor histidine kinase n=1 Tax=Microvirga antarctica TaxID=2819233 RepID=UPI001B30DD6F|nr:HAMP domain-containing sensor histidine kinase [Microvirga antarctica]
MKDNLTTGLPVDDPLSQASLRQQIAVLTESVAARDAFLAVAAHELRNPMTPILAHVQRLARISAVSGDPEMAKGLKRLERLVEHYIRRATALLEVSRMTTGKLVLNPERFDLADLLRDAVEAVRPAALYVGSTLSLEAPDECSVVLDRLAVEQILDNLISNAVKYGAGRPVELILSTGPAHADIHVKDQGAGISAADQSRIFDRFERAVSQGSTIGGFGVGLWVVGQLVDAMGADIKVDSVVGAGTTFTLSLPLEASRHT